MFFAIRRLLVICCIMLWAAPAGGSGDTVYEKTQEARRHFREQRCDQAIPLLESVTAENPADGLAWEALGHCYLALGRYRESIAAFMTCLDLGYRNLHSMYNLACVHARSGDLETALQWLASAYRAGYIDDAHVRTDSDLDPLRSDPRFQELTGLPQAELGDRTSRWRHDLQYLFRRLQDVHFDLYANITEERMTDRLTAIAESIPERTDLELRYEIQRLLAEIGDGHTGIVLERFRQMHRHGEMVDGDACRTYPIDPWLFGDQLYIRAARPGLEELIGTRVVRIGNRDVSEVLIEVNQLVSRDNRWGAQWIATEYLRDPDALTALGVASEEGTVELNVTDSTGKETKVKVAATSCKASAELISAHRESDRPLPRYLRDISKPISFDVMENPNLVWVQFNSVQDTPHESIAQFTERLFQHMNESQAEHLVIDLRHNHGGNGQLARPLLHRLIGSERVNRTGHLFVITSRETFSAAMSFATQLETHTKALFVGEPTGSRPNFVGESSIFTLPYSRIPVSCSSRYHQNGDPTDTRTCIAPDMPAPITIDAFRDNRDPAYEVICAFIARESGVPN
jgi:tetratricopeptide (TPR) repeat protein